MKFHVSLLSLFVLMAAPAAADVMQPVDYVTTASASDLFEVQSAGLVLQTTHDAKVRAFARMMIADHGKSSGELASAAQKSHVAPPPPALTPLQTELLAELRATSGAPRDALYIAQQKSAHNQALTLQKAYATDGSVPGLKATAAQTVPVVAHHIEALKSM